MLIDLIKVMSIEEISSLSETTFSELISKELEMPYEFTNSKGNTYILHARERVLKSGKTSKMFFFAKEAKEGAIDAVPAGYVVSETRNGLPVLKKAE